ncbi:MAG: putative metal-binding motif-containing protein, partial [Myxococcota bacterium]
MSLRIFLLPLLLALCACVVDDKSPVDVDGEGYSGDADCDDSPAAIHPGTREICDGLDGDCDGEVDEEPSDGSTFYRDDDRDGFGAAADGKVACDVPDGYVPDASDCDDDVASTHPGAREVCGGGDEDCDGTVDDADVDVDPATFVVGYADEDGDGAGDAVSPVYACVLGDGVVAGADDCDDTRSDVRPGGEETCDGADNDCDGTADEDAVDAPVWFADTDGDGAGSPTDWLSACVALPGHVADSSDCDDTRASKLADRSPQRRSCRVCGRCRSHS